MAGREPLLGQPASRRPLIGLLGAVGLTLCACLIALAAIVGTAPQLTALEEVDAGAQAAQASQSRPLQEAGNALVQRETPRTWWHWSQDPRFNRREGKEGLEKQFSHWLDKWHNDHPDATLNAESAAWGRRQKEIQKMFDWEAEQRRKLVDEAARNAADSVPMPEVDAEAEARRYGSGVAFNPLDSTRRDNRDPFPSHPSVESEQERAAPVSPKPVRKPADSGKPDAFSEDNEEEGALPGWDELIKDRKGRGEVVGRPASAEDFVASHFDGMEEPAVPHFDKTPETIIAEPPGPPDFNGQDAIIASHPDIGINPTDLEENNMETRGSFTVQLARTGYMGDGEVAMTIWGPPSEFKCTLRGYRKLSNDFQGNSVYTGFKKAFVGERKISTGYISPGVTNEYDIMDCRSEVTGETQYFRVSFGTDGYDDLRDNGPPNVLGDHFGMNTDSVTFDMDRPTYEDQQATQDYYRDYDVMADNKPFK